MSAERYPIPARIHRVEQTVRRSRFVTTLAHAPDARAARAFVQRVTEELPDASHHCWAFVAGPPGSTRSVGMSDAGEPGGTAGRPMLGVLLHAHVGEVVAVVSRWFGGTKLGTGGLARAYAGGVKQALEGLPLEEKVQRAEAELVLDYPSLDGVRRLLESLEAAVLDEDYGARVCYRVALPSDRTEELARGLADLTGGQGTLRLH